MKNARPPDRWLLKQTSEWGVAEEHGYFVSVVSTSYEDYDRELFVDTLNDWQWFGPGDPPEWYTGQPW